jgi:NADH-quinone oxidoreductase subunit J
MAGQEGVFEISGTVELTVFFILAAIGVFSAVVVVTGRNMFHNILFFGLFLLSLAGLYLLLTAEFLAMVQIFGYVGGIVVLILFVVMLTPRVTEAEPETSAFGKISSSVVSLLLLGPVFYVLKSTLFSARTTLLSAKDPVSHSTPALGKMLLSSHAIPFEIVAVALLVAIVGAVAIVREESKE